MSAEHIVNEKGRRFKGEKKKKNKNKIIIILLILVIVGGIVFYFSKDKKIFSTEKQNNSETNKEESSKLLKEKEYNEMKISDINLKVDDSASYFKCNVKNMTDSNLEKKEVYIVFENKDKKELARFKYVINDLEPNGTSKISIATTTSLAEVYDFHIEE